MASLCNIQTSHAGASGGRTNPDNGVVAGYLRRRIRVT
jgi:hypothetical protein